ncbi:MAG: hypothetical protein ACI9VR_002152 [Cognaticolwellia sp.]|jgi:hypothetical protein
MNKKYAIPAAALALAGATGCTDPIVADWELTKLVSDGEVYELDRTYMGDFGYEYSVSIVGALSIDKGLGAELVVDVTYTSTNPGGETHSGDSALSYNGEVSPGTDKGTYGIALDEDHRFNCELKNSPKELECDMLDSNDNEHWSFEPA